MKLKEILQEEVKVETQVETKKKDKGVSAFLRARKRKYLTKAYRVGDQQQGDATADGT